MSERRVLPDRPDLRRLRGEAKSRRRAGEFPTLALAHLAIAREHGFVSWPRLKHHVEALTLDVDERAEALVRSACSSNVRRALALLEVDPELARHDLACACACGEVAEVARLLDRAPGRAGEATGPLGRAPILYACFSRLSRVDPARGAGIRAVVQLLIDSGADPDSRFLQGDWIQSTLYGAAGILGDAELTAMLIDAGADPNDDEHVHTVGEALYHACELPDPACARLLIEAGTKPGTVDYCLNRVLNFPNLEMVRMFCAHGARPNGGSIQQAVSRRRDVETVRVLLDAGAPVDGLDEGVDPTTALTPLQIAVRWGADELAALLLARGADPRRVGDGDRALGALLAGRGAGAPDALPSTGEMLVLAVQRGDLAAVRGLLDAGAPVDGDGADEFSPIAEAAWRGHDAVAAELASRGARLTFPDGGSAIGAALHGSRHCHDPEGGPTMATIDEVDHGRYAATVRTLLEAGAPVPERFGDGPGGPSVASILAELGVQP
jgi:ankyrin repeat protein